MPAKFVEVKPEQVKESAVKLIGTDWMLITAGQPEAFNTMTASWGALGVMWNKPIAMIVVRRTPRSIRA